ncbi:H/ACA ribonucleoprotein complex subunit 2-like protein [Apis mellifera caucasica]|uniref:H/ACA snoRNP protein NHP2 n=1 Tax=Apis mellifera TaxID=7460 RepID=A0A7M7R8U9_APIME|nr:H/ACA ribonucleoprotein complex subunit 2-like protein [Apis mellifera]KAG6795141.1 H/ACA ribonucleoprotein complex subunit 2-like protein [Apis mellifera caucasica]KAG9428556.1 H/ACA ribonucleoprotein complex subunit 2-like protein [Apis mellifera carnica]|eukprot:XP_625159.2 H/ACA ribonucleoprotein complex subunit 2-like protein [Apis mellifera]
MESVTIKMEVDDSVKEADSGDVIEISYEEKLKYTNSIAKPMASKKLTKKIYKCIKKASKHKSYLRNGLKDVQKHLRKGEKGLVVFAGDVFPIEIMCHLPIVCEDKNIPYCYTPSRQDIGTAMGVKRGSLMVLIKEHEEYKDLYEEIKSNMITLSMPL